MIQLIHDDFRNHLPKLPASTIHSVITDPPYARKYHHLFGDASRECSRVLVPSGAFITYSGQYNFPDVLNHLREHLSYYWNGFLHHAGSPNYRQELNLYTCGKPYVIMHRAPNFRPIVPIYDYLKGSGRSKSHHDWEQPVEEAREFIRWSTRPGEIVLDPFCGSGTTLLAAHLEGRQAIGIEIEKETYDLARRRLIKEGVEVFDWPAPKTSSERTHSALL